MEVLRRYRQQKFAQSDHDQSALACHDAGVAEWRGTGLQSRSHGFESRHPLVSETGRHIACRSLLCGPGSRGRLR